MPLDEYIIVEVVYATQQCQPLLGLKVQCGTTAIEAVRQSGLDRYVAEVNIKNLTLGIFGKHVPHDTVLRQCDRVEIYRPLLVDPKNGRRQRALSR